MLCGFIVVNDAGGIIRGPRGIDAPDLIPTLDAVIGRTVLDFSDQNTKFFAAHRRRHTKLARR